MFRETAQIVLAIQLSSPSLPIKRAEQLAATMQKNADIVNIDPLIIVAIAEHESEFYESKISQDGFDYGLMQIRALHYGGKPEWLLWGENNIRVGSYIMKKDIEFCEKHLGYAPAADQWLSCYAGQCTTPDHWCKSTKLTRQFTDYASCLERAVSDIEQESSVDCRKIYGRK